LVATIQTSAAILEIEVGRDDSETRTIYDFIRDRALRLTRPLIDAATPTQGSCLSRG
jgi:hypothetical protein